jgi:hypothetical protein
MGQIAQRNLLWPVGKTLGHHWLRTRFITREKQRKGIISPSIITQITNQVQNSRTVYGNNIALVMGSGAWDILADSRGQGTDFWDHRRALRQLIVACHSHQASLLPWICTKSPSRPCILIKFSSWILSESFTWVPLEPTICIVPKGNFAGTKCNLFALISCHLFIDRALVDPWRLTLLTRIQPENAQLVLRQGQGSKSDEK